MNGRSKDIRPVVGTRFEHAGRCGEVCATYPGPGGFCIVGLYDAARWMDDERKGTPDTHYVGPWSACRALPTEAAA